MGLFTGINNFFSGNDKTVTAPEKQQGEPGSRLYGGYPDEQEKNPALTGRAKYKTFSNILANVSIVAAGTRYFLNILSEPAWKVEPARFGDDDEPTPESERIAKLIADIMADMETPWHKVIRRAAMYRFYGFSVQEWVAKRRPDGVTGYLDVEARPQITIEKWSEDDTGRVNGMIQRSPLSGEELDIQRGKTIYLVDDTLNDSPEGIGLFRHLVKPAAELDRLEQLEGFGFETDLRGMPIGRAPIAELEKQVKRKEITSQIKELILAPLRKMISNPIKSAKNGMLLDSLTYQTTDDKRNPSSVYQWDIELLKSSASNQAEVNKTIERKNRELARILGVEGLLLGSSDRGSEALSRDKTHNFMLIVQSTQKELIEGFQKDFLTPLFDLNGWDYKNKPTFKTDMVRYREIQEITQALRDMAQAGAILDPDDPAINEVRDIMGLSRPDNVLSDIDLSIGGDRDTPPPKATPPSNENT